MASIPSLIFQREFAAAGYLVGWKVISRAPRKMVNKLFYWGADRLSDEGKSMSQLRANLARVVGIENVTSQLVRDATRSYARYWSEAFRLPSLTKDQALQERLAAGIIGREYFDESFNKGKGVILVLPHSGNWDMAGMWLVNNYGSFTTVAERLKPEVLFQAFVDFRESLGFKVLALSGGSQPPFDVLKQRLLAGEVVCLLGERDLPRSGVPVTFFGEETTMPAGPALLAQETGAAIHVVHSWYNAEDDGSNVAWGLSASEPIEVTTVEETTQKIADGFAANIATHPQDWHMLQALWPADVKARKLRKS